MYETSIHEPIPIQKSGIISAKIVTSNYSPSFFGSMAYIPIEELTPSYRQLIILK